MNSEKLPEQPSDPFENAPSHADVLSFDLVPSVVEISVGHRIFVNARCVMTDGSTLDWMVIDIAVGDQSVLQAENDWQFCRTFSGVGAGSTTLSAEITDRFGNVRRATRTIVVGDRTTATQQSEPN